MQGTRKKRINKPGKRLFLACIFTTLVSGCHLLPVSKPWKYINTPNLNDEVVFPDDAVVCLSLGGAQFMASTGFYAPDCSSELPQAFNARVEEILKFTINGVAMNIVVTTIDSNTYWIPLPDHNWI